MSKSGFGISWISKQVKRGYGAIITAMEVDNLLACPYKENEILLRIHVKIQPYVAFQNFMSI